MPNRAIPGPMNNKTMLFSHYGPNLHLCADPDYTFVTSGLSNTVLQPTENEQSDQ